MAETDSEESYPTHAGGSWDVAEPMSAYDADGAAGREERYRQAAGLLRRWVEEGEGDEDELWPLVSEELASGRTRI